MNASPRSDFAPAEPHRGRAALNAAGSTIHTGCPAPAITPTISPSPRSIAIGNVLAAASSPSSMNNSSECALGVLDQPSPHDRTVVVDDAHTMVCRAPIPSTEHLLTSRSDIAAGAGPTVGSSLFGPRGAALLRRSRVPATTRATNSNRPSRGKTSRPSLAVPDEQANTACTRDTHPMRTSRSIRSSAFSRSSPRT